MNYVIHCYQYYITWLQFIKLLHKSMTWLKIYRLFCTKWHKNPSIVSLGPSTIIKPANNRLESHTDSPVSRVFLRLPIGLHMVVQLVKKHWAKNYVRSPILTPIWKTYFRFNTNILSQARVNVKMDLNVMCVIRQLQFIKLS